MVIGWILAGVMGAILLALLMILGSFLLRGGPISELEIVGGPDGQLDLGSEEFCSVLQSISKTGIDDGHRLALFAAGDAAFDRLLSEVAAARRLVTWQIYWWRPGTLADRVAEVLAGRARAGVDVRCLVDWYGAQDLGDAYWDRLRQAGVQVAVFRPFDLRRLYKVQQRAHVRSVVVDGGVGFTGGFGVDDRWMGDGRTRPYWRDTTIRVEGPAVLQMQGAFAANWAEATGRLMIGTDVFSTGRDLGPERGARAGLMYSSPSFGSTSAERFLHSLVRAAGERLYLTTAYFVPDAALREALCKAAGRGVDVRVLTPGRNTDEPATWYAASRHYGYLLSGGVRVFEYRPTMLHAKTIVADGRFGMVGTLNLDNRSLVLNDEVALLFQDRATCRELESHFAADLEYADEVHLDAWRRRPRSDRLKERAAGLVSHLL